MERVDRKAAESRRKDAVGGTGRSPALNVSEHDVSHFERAALLFEGRHDFGGSAQRIPFRDDHNNRALSEGLESPQVGDDPFDRGGRLRNRDDFAPARERDVRREIPAMPAHNLDEKHHVVTSRRVAELIDRVEEDSVTEIIIATNPSVEGESTAVLLEKLLHEKYPDLKITRLARGLPLGVSLEYADQITLTSALNNRTNI